MSTYTDLIAVINGLLANTEIKITVPWCTQQGLTVDQNLVKDWGKLLHQEYGKYSLVWTGKTSNNLHHYRKV